MHLPLHKAMKCNAGDANLSMHFGKEGCLSRAAASPHPPLWRLPPLFCPTRSRLKAVEAWQQIDDDCLSQPPETGVCSALPEP